MRPAAWGLALALPLLATAAPPAAADQACAGCHEKVAASFRATPMARALEPVTECEILRQHPSLAFQEGGFQWRIVRQGNASIMTVTSGGESLTVPLLWAFGRGQAGQTYVFERGGVLFESRVSFYNALNGLDLTMGAQQSQARNIDDAAGRRMDSGGARDCFGCHSAGAVTGGKLHMESLHPGVGCESCHGNADRHLAAVQAGKPESAPMPRLGKQSAEEAAELCGKCHRTWSQIALSGPRGVLNVRFQPYRLTNSKCFDTTDSRLACAACHDPHGPLDTQRLPATMPGARPATPPRCTLRPVPSPRPIASPKPYAENRIARRARTLHGSPDPHRPRRRGISKLR